MCEHSGLNLRTPTLTLDESQGHLAVLLEISALRPATVWTRAFREYSIGENNVCLFSGRP